MFPHQTPETVTNRRQIRFLSMWRSGCTKIKSMKNRADPVGPSFFFPLSTFRLPHFNKHHTAATCSLRPHSAVRLHDYSENTHKNSISGCAYELLPISSPGAALDQNLLIIFCQPFAHVDCLPLVSRRHLEQLHRRKNTRGCECICE